MHLDEQYNSDPGAVDDNNFIFNLLFLLAQQHVAVSLFDCLIKSPETIFACLD